MGDPFDVLAQRMMEGQQPANGKAAQRPLLPITTPELIQAVHDVFGGSAGTEKPGFLRRMLGPTGAELAPRAAVSPPIAPGPRLRELLPAWEPDAGPRPVMMAAEPGAIAPDATAGQLTRADAQAAAAAAGMVSPTHPLAQPFAPSANPTRNKMRVDLALGAPPAPPNLGEVRIPLHAPWRADRESPAFGTVTVDELNRRRYQAREEQQQRQAAPPEAEPEPVERPSLWKRLLHGTKVRVESAGHLGMRSKLDAMKEEIIADERAFRRLHGLYNPNDVTQSRAGAPVLPPEVRQRLEAGAARGRPINPDEPITDDTSLRLDITDEVNAGLLMVSPTARDRQLELMAWLREVQPEQLPEARGLIEKSAQFVGEVAPYLAEAALFRGMSGAAVARLPSKVAGPLRLGLQFAGAEGLEAAAGMPGASPGKGFLSGAALGGVGEVGGAAGRAFQYSGNRVLRTLAPFPVPLAQGAYFGTLTGLEGGDVQDIIISGPLGAFLFNINTIAKYPFRWPTKLAPPGPRPRGGQGQAAAPGEGDVPTGTLEKLVTRWEALGKEAERDPMAMHEVIATGQALQRLGADLEKNPRRFSLRDIGIWDAWKATQEWRLRQRIQDATENGEVEEHGAEERPGDDRGGPAAGAGVGGGVQEGRPAHDQGGARGGPPAEVEGQAQPEVGQAPGVKRAPVGLAAPASWLYGMTKEAILTPAGADALAADAPEVADAIRNGKALSQQALTMEVGGVAPEAVKGTWTRGERQKLHALVTQAIEQRMAAKEFEGPPVAGQGFNPIPVEGQARAAPPVRYEQRENPDTGEWEMAPVTEAPGPAPVGPPPRRRPSPKRNQAAVEFYRPAEPQQPSPAPPEHPLGRPPADLPAGPQPTAPVAAAPPERGSRAALAAAAPPWVRGPDREAWLDGRITDEEVVDRILEVGPYLDMVVPGPHKDATERIRRSALDELHEARLAASIEPPPAGPQPTAPVAVPPPQTARHPLADVVEAGEAPGMDEPEWMAEFGGLEDATPAQKARAVLGPAGESLRDADVERLVGALLEAFNGDAGDPMWREPEGLGVVARRLYQDWARELFPYHSVRGQQSTGRAPVIPPATVSPIWRDLVGDYMPSARGRRPAAPAAASVTAEQPAIAPAGQRWAAAWPPPGSVPPGPPKPAPAASAAQPAPIAHPLASEMGRERPGAPEAPEHPLADQPEPAPVGPIVRYQQRENPETGGWEMWAATGKPTPGPAEAAAQPAPGAEPALTAVSAIQEATAALEAAHAQRKAVSGRGAGKAGDVITADQGMAGAGMDLFLAHARAARLESRPTPENRPDYVALFDPQQPDKSVTVRVGGLFGLRDPMTDLTVPTAKKRGVRAVSEILDDARNAATRAAALLSGKLQAVTAVDKETGVGKTTVRKPPAKKTPMRPRWGLAESEEELFEIEKAIWRSGQWDNLTDWLEPVESSREKRLNAIAGFVLSNHAELPAYQVYAVLRYQRRLNVDLAQSAKGVEGQYIPDEQLTVGDKMKVAGEQYRVTDIDPETGQVTVKDGVTLELPKGKGIAVDRGSYQPNPESTEFQAPPPELAGPAVPSEDLPPEEPPVQTAEHLTPEEPPVESGEEAAERFPEGVLDPEMEQRIRDHLREHGPHKPTAGMGADIARQEFRNRYQRWFDRLAKKLKGDQYSAGRWRSILEWAERGFWGPGAGLTTLEYRAAERVRGEVGWAKGLAGKLTAGIKAERRAEGLPAAAIGGRAGGTVSGTDTAVLQALRGERLASGLTPKQKELHDLYYQQARADSKALLDWVDEKPERERDIVYAGGLRNIIDRIRQAYEAGKAYVPMLYVRPETRTAEPFGRESREVGVGFGVRGAQFKARRSDDAWTVRMVNGEHVQFDDHNDAADAWTAETQANLEQYGLSVYDRVKLLDPFGEEVKERLVPIQDAAHVLAYGLVRTRENLENLKFMEYLSMTAAVPEGAQTPFDEKVPNDPRWGALRGKWVPASLWRHLSEVQTVKKNLFTFYTWHLPLAMWKTKTVIWNLPTWGRNWMGDPMLAILNGWNPVLDMPYVLDAVRELKDQGPIWELLVRNNEINAGLSRSLVESFAERLDLAKGKVDGLLKAFFAGVEAFTDVSDKLGTVYDLPNQVLKITAYIKARAQGFEVDEALEKLRGLPNYARQGRWSRLLSKVPWGAPFVAFLDQAAKAFYYSLRDHPYRFLGVAAAPGLLSLFSSTYLRMKGDLTDEELELANQQRGRQGVLDWYFQPLLPWRDKDGKLQFLNLLYIYPWANDFKVETGPGGIMAPLLLQQPPMQTAMGVMMNRDPYTGKNLWDPEAGWGTVIPKAARFAWRKMGPLPSMIEKGVPRTLQAAFGESDRGLLKTVLKEFFGLDIQTPYISRTAARKLVEEKLGAGDEFDVILELWNEKYRADDERAFENKDIRRMLRGVGDVEVD